MGLVEKSLKKRGSSRRCHAFLLVGNLKCDERPPGSRAVFHGSLQNTMRLNADIPTGRWGSIHVAKDVPEHLNDQGALG
ncbi:MAG: hypothetical protein JRD87_03565 [Deltaproteobacteria bacterium]|jgi:hypothetical protein|nr:hypothetical protein [Deltaproteobacteria bacterium]MBW2573185.1 hypothetical protein [Deltaproteobacteria bacterium]MBW2668958.1 hypothetical protein [Deltaproteobacteria bacterium]MBW2710397.1 hypothetical protein [Deltaproteobacteria bacterium]